MRKLKKCCGLLRVAVIASMLAVFIIPLSCGQSSEQPLNAFTATVIDSDPVDEYTFEREEFIETSVSYMDYLTPPTPYPSPMPDTYEQFFNFRLENFSPKTEPLMEERFGKRLGIKKKSLWVYPSYNSFAIGFAANPPVISAIEYGETDSYGNSAPISESYFYNHLHYLKNLKEATIYHYRIIIQDEDGNAIATPDRTFTTKTFGAETKLYQTDFTHTDDKGVSGSGLWIRASGVYVLMEDIASEGLGVNVKADDVTIDLNGHTLIYDNGNNALNDTSDGDYNEHGSWGIRAGLWNFRSANIYNGVIKQGEKGSPGRAPLYLVTMANYNEYNQKNEIAGLTVDYYSDSAPGMYTDKGYIHHNLLYDRGNKVSDRHMGIRAMQANETGYSEVAYNSLRRFRHRGINSGLFVHDNELYSDSFATNSFALNAGDNATVINNKVFGMGDNPIGIGWGSDLRVADNFVYIWCYSPTQRFDEYEVRSSSVAGMRFTHLTAQNYANMLFLKAITLC